MKYKIAIASGKGGTGKTTVAVNLYNLFRKHFSNVNLIDFDVEEPNDLIFFPEAEMRDEITVNQTIPVFDESECTYCQKCSGYCEFNAISVIPSVKHISVDTSLCHSCGACLHACDFGAVSERNEPIGKIGTYKQGDKVNIAEGRLRVGSAMQTMLIKALKKQKLAATEPDISIFDSPPGTSCSVVETIIDTDYVVLVAEPTPFGVHDLKLMVKLVRDLELSFGVVINKAGLGNDDIYEFLNKEQIEIIGEVPFSREFAVRYSSGDMFSQVPAEIVSSYENISNALLEKMEVLC